MGWAVLGAGAALVAVSLPAQELQAKVPPDVQRGKYLVERVAMCGDCHTPHDARGEPVAGRELTGAPLPFRPTVEMPWASVAPPIAGLPSGWSRADVVKLLTTGLGPNGVRPAPPMPPYRLAKADAEAVASYLQSLGAVTAK